MWTWHRYFSPAGVARPAAALALLVPALLASGCDPIVQCTAEARSSVTVTVSDDTGAPVIDGQVTYSVDGGAEQDCENLIDGSWVCGWEEAGQFVIKVQKEGYSPVEEQVTVTEDECHVQTELLAVTLEPVAATTFDPARQYYVQLIEDEDECARSWELYEMNCYMTADFCADGTSSIIVTDIINDGTYRIDGATLTVTATQGGDLPDTVVFQIESETTLRDPFGDVWTLDVNDKLIDSCP